jgi:uncharacterized protein (DUF58 family)
VVEGFVAGLHRSPFLGFSVDFAEYRQYMPGDDIRRIDWKVYARTDRHYVKEYEGETNTYVYLLLDTSASMAYSTTPVSKIEYACFLAASLAYFAQRQKDNVGLVTFDKTIVNKIPPQCQAGHLSRILHVLDRVEPIAQSEFQKPFDIVARSLRRRGIVILISDLLAPTNDIIRGLHQFRHKGNDVLVFQIMDPRERKFEFKARGQFQDLETRQVISVIPEQAIGEYLQRLQKHTDKIAQECGALGIDYLQMETTQQLDFALYSYLSTRRKSM